MSGNRQPSDNQKTPEKLKLVGQFLEQARKLLDEKNVNKAITLLNWLIKNQNDVIKMDIIPITKEKILNNTIALLNEALTQLQNDELFHLRGKTYLSKAYLLQGHTTQENKQQTEVAFNVMINAAIQDFNKAIHQNNKRAIHYLFRAQAYLHQHQYQNASLDLQQTMRLDNLAFSYHSHSIAFGKCLTPDEQNALLTLKTACEKELHHTLPYPKDLVDSIACTTALWLKQCKRENTDHLPNAANLIADELNHLNSLQHEEISKGNLKESFVIHEIMLGMIALITSVAKQKIELVFLNFNYINIQELCPRFLDLLAKNDKFLPLKLDKKCRLEVKHAFEQILNMLRHFYIIQDSFNFKAIANFIYVTEIMRFCDLHTSNAFIEQKPSKTIEGYTLLLHSKCPCCLNLDADTIDELEKKIKNLNDNIPPPIPHENTIAENKQALNECKEKAFEAIKNSKNEKKKARRKTSQEKINFCANDTISHDTNNDANSLHFRAENDSQQILSELIAKSVIIAEKNKQEYIKKQKEEIERNQQLAQDQMIANTLHEIETKTIGTESEFLFASIAKIDIPPEVQKFMVSMKMLLNNETSARTYLTGGYIRDHLRKKLLGIERKIQDFDIVTGAHLTNINIYKLCEKVGLTLVQHYTTRHGDIKMILHRDHANTDSLIIELSHSTALADEQCSRTEALRRDARRRDVKQNAFYASYDGRVYYPLDWWRLYRLPTVDKMNQLLTQSKRKSHPGISNAIFLIGNSQTVRAYLVNHEGEFIYQDSQNKLAIEIQIHKKDKFPLDKYGQIVQLDKGELLQRIFNAIISSAYCPSSLKRVIVTSHLTSDNNELKKMLSAEHLETILDPKQSFHRDPIRILRIIYYTIVLGYEDLSSAVKIAIQENINRYHEFFKQYPGHFNAWIGKCLSADRDKVEIIFQLLQNTGIVEKSFSLLEKALHYDRVLKKWILHELRHEPAHSLNYIYAVFIKSIAIYTNTINSPIEVIKIVQDHDLFRENFKDPYHYEPFYQAAEMSWDKFHYDFYLKTQYHILNSLEGNIAKHIQQHPFFKEQLPLYLQQARAQHQLYEQQNQLMIQLEQQLLQTLKPPYRLTVNSQSFFHHPPQPQHVQHQLTTHHHQLSQQSKQLEQFYYLPNKHLKPIARQLSNLHQFQNKLSELQFKLYQKLTQ